MFRTVSLTLLLAMGMAFVGRVLALEIVVGGALGNITASEMLAIPQGPWTAACTTPCNAVNASVIACNDINDACLCKQEVATQLTQCQQCMYEQLISSNTRAPDVRVGTNVGLSAYATACKTAVNVTLTQVALTIPTFWDGPSNIKLNTPASVVVIGVGAFMGVSALYLFANLA